MSSADYVAMRTPKRGLKSAPVEADIHHEDPALWRPSSLRDLPASAGARMIGGFWQTLLWAPFNDPEKRPDLWSSITVMILVFLGCLFNGWVLHAAYAHALAVAGDAFIRAILIAAVSGSLFYVTQLWTYESALMTYVYPELSMAMIPTLRVGILTALLYGVFQFGGYAAAGGILRAINGVTPGVTNVATGKDAYVLYWFGGVFIVFNYVYNMMFHQTSMEPRARAHMRASAAAALAIFGITVAFYTLGLFTYSSGLYVTGVILTGNNSAGDASVVPWAYYVFVALLAVPATVGILYVLIGWFTSGDMPTLRFTSSEIPMERSRPKRAQPIEVAY